MNIKVDFDNIVVREDNNDTLVKILMLKGEKGDAGDGQNNVIEKVQVNGTDLPVTNKTVNVAVPTVDSTLSSNSTNPVQNRAIYNALNNKADISELGNYYEVSEVDNLLNNKVDNLTLNNYYTKDETYNQNDINSIISTKANTSDIANTYETIANHNNDINSLSSQISSLASGSPLIASSISEMTDTSRVYVNTSDGHWYYYDGTSWVDGGTYQATSLSEGEILPYQTSFYEDNNLYPKYNYVTGKVLNVNSGNEQTWANGSYNPEYIEVDYTKLYIVINNSKLTYSTPTFYTYDENKTYLGYVRPNADNRTYSVTFGSTVKYIRVSFWNINTPTLTNDCIFLKLEDALNLLSYEKNYYIKDNYFNTIKTDNIIIPNEYGFRLLPYQSVTLGQPYSTLNYPTIYEMNSTNPAQNGSNFIGVQFDYDITKLQAGDKIYVDVTGSSNFNNLTLFATNSSTQNTLTAVNEGNNIYSLTLTQDLITVMNNTKGVNNYYPRLMLIRTNLTAGETITTNMRCWINEDFSNLTNYLEYVVEKLNESKTKSTLTALVLGDSITALTGDRSWLTYFNQIQPINVIQNVAVSGAWLMDKQGTIYDGNPVYNGADNNVNNVLGNQVQKILNNDYDDPDIIMIAIGTNAGLDTTSSDIYDSYYDSNGDLIPLSSLDRKTVAGAFRYCNETLRTKYPNATIFWCSPIYAANISSKPISRVNEWANNLELMCKCGGSQFINTMNCGIVPTTENVDSNGLYLADGLHPNSNGAKYMGYYNATKVKEYSESAKLLN